MEVTVEEALAALGALVGAQAEAAERWCRRRVSTSLPDACVLLLGDTSDALGVHAYETFIDRVRAHLDAPVISALVYAHMAAWLLEQPDVAAQAPAASLEVLEAARTTLGDLVTVCRCEVDPRVVWALAGSWTGDVDDLLAAAASVAAAP